VKLTFKNVIDKVGAVNASTLSFQRDKFIEFIPYTGKGRARRYGQEAVEVLTITSTMYASGKTYEEIREVLENKCGIPTVGDLVVKDNTTTQLDIIAEIKGVFREEVARLEGKIDSLSRGNDEHDRLLMEHIREHQRKKKWWQRK